MTYAIGDIHGCNRTFCALLETLALQAGVGDSQSIRSRILDTIDFVIQITKDGQPGMIEEVLQVTQGGSGPDYRSRARVLFSRYAPSGAHP